jgi:WD40 repeat protein
LRIKLKGGDGDYVGAPVFTPDGKTLAVPGKKGTLDLWDSLTGRRLLSLPGQTEAIAGFQFSGDGKVVLVGYETNVTIFRTDRKQR